MSSNGYLLDNDDEEGASLLLSFQSNSHPQSRDSGDSGDGGNGGDNSRNSHPQSRDSGDSGDGGDGGDNSSGTSSYSDSGSSDSDSGGSVGSSAGSSSSSSSSNSDSNSDSRSQEDGAEEDGADTDNNHIRPTLTPVKSIHLSQKATSRSKVLAGNIISTQQRVSELENLLKEFTVATEQVRMHLTVLVMFYPIDNDRLMTIGVNHNSIPSLGRINSIVNSMLGNPLQMGAEHNQTDYDKDQWEAFIYERPVHSDSITDSNDYDTNLETPWMPTHGHKAIGNPNHLKTTKLFDKDLSSDVENLIAKPEVLTANLLTKEGREIWRNHFGYKSNAQVTRSEIADHPSLTYYLFYKEFNELMSSDKLNTTISTSMIEGQHRLAAAAHAMCGCLCVESGILRSTNSVSVLFEDQGQNQNTNRSISRYWWDTIGISTTDSLLDSFVLPDKDEYLKLLDKVISVVVRCASKQLQSSHNATVVDDLLPSIVKRSETYANTKHCSSRIDLFHDLSIKIDLFDQRIERGAEITIASDSLHSSNSASKDQRTYYETILPEKTGTNRRNWSYSDNDKDGDKRPAFFENEQLRALIREPTTHRLDALRISMQEQVEAKPPKIYGLGHSSSLTGQIMPPYITTPQLLIHTHDQGHEDGQTCLDCYQQNQILFTAFIFATIHRRLLNQDVKSQVLEERYFIMLKHCLINLSANFSKGRSYRPQGIGECLDIELTLALSELVSSANTRDNLSSLALALRHVKTRSRSCWSDVDTARQIVNFVKLYQVKTFILKEALPEITARMTGEAIKRSKAYSTWIVYMAMLQELVTVLQDFGIDPRSNSMYDKLIGCPQLRAINDLTDRCMTSKTAADLQKQLFPRDRSNKLLYKYLERLSMTTLTTVNTIQSSSLLFLVQMLKAESDAQMYGVMQRREGFQSPSHPIYLVSGSGKPTDTDGKPMSERFSIHSVTVTVRAGNANKTAYLTRFASIDARRYSNGNSNVRSDTIARSLFQHHEHVTIDGSDIKQEISLLEADVIGCKRTLWYPENHGLIGSKPSDNENTGIAEAEEEVVEGEEEEEEEETEEAIDGNPFQRKRDSTKKQNMVELVKQLSILSRTNKSEEIEDEGGSSLAEDVTRIETALNRVTNKTKDIKDQVKALNTLKRKLERTVAKEENLRQLRDAVITAGTNVVWEEYYKPYEIDNQESKLETMIQDIESSEQVENNTSKTKTNKPRSKRAKKNEN